MSYQETVTETSVRPIYLLVSVALFCGLFALSYPYYRYFIDPDAVAYLTMAKRAAEGDHWRLVNALWSPLHPAMVALCIKAGMNEVLAAQLTNGLACIIILCCSYGLFRRYKVERFAAGTLLMALPLFLVYALYKQLFCDLWQVGLLLIYLLLITSKDFVHSMWRIIVCGLVMGLAAYAKVYSFYFLLLHLPVALYIIGKKERSTRFPVKAYIGLMVIQLLVLAPWVGLMHHKYGGWGLSKSGALNTSWTLTGHKTHKEGIITLIPPPYPNSPYTWEDPYLAEGKIHSRFESIAMVKSQVGHSIQAVLQGVNVASEISPFLLAVLVGALLVVLFKKDQQVFTTDHKILIAAACIMPIGYLLLHFEARYIWLLLFIAMILGTRLLQVFWQRSGPHGYRIAVLLFALSFMTYPIYDLKALFRKGEDIYNEAGVLKSLGISGSFTSNASPSRSGALAYWMGANYYTPTSESVQKDAVISDMQRYKVRYYVYYRGGLDVGEVQIMDALGRPYTEVGNGKINNLKVFLVNP